MFKIGDFSRLSFVTAKTLHYYDEIGLLKPVRVDRFTGYRYYSADQLPRLNHIRSLRSLGLSLEQIATLIDDSFSSSQMRSILVLKQAELRQRIDDEQQRLDKVGELLRQIEKEEKHLDYQVVIKEIAAMRIASVRGTVPTYHDITMLIHKIVPIRTQHADSIAGPMLAIYHDTEYREKDVDIEVAIPISRDLTLRDTISVRDLPGEKTAATTLHLGPYETIGETGTALMQWCEANGYELAGPDREVFLANPGDTDDPVNYVTELQQPVRKV